MTDDLTTIKACGDCRHIEFKPFRAVCRHPSGDAEIIDYVTGKPRTHAMSVEIMRGTVIGKCGPEAKLFEPKEA
jgi:hypothetical protein